MSFTPGINDRKWQLILIPVISFILSVIIGAKQLLLCNGRCFPVQLFITLVIFTSFIWEANLIVYRKLDRRIPFFENPKQRFIQQVVYGFLATIITFCGLYLVMAIIIKAPLNFSLFLKYLFVASAISFTINSLYVFKYLQTSIYYREHVKTKELNEKLEQLLLQKETIPFIEDVTSIQETKTKEIKSILVEAGNKTINILFEDVAYFMSGEGIVTLVKNDGQKLTTNYNSFSYISNRLPVQFFFQLNRQIITHLQSVRSVTDDVNRKLIVKISPCQQPAKIELVTVSRYRNPEFKQWFTEQLSPGK